jgi:hypothetical protein
MDTLNTLNNLNNILNQSFQDELNRHNNRPINTSENVNVSNLFTKLQGHKTDCNICYNEVQCLQCYQCQFNYCQDCMTKVISEYNKCSACQANFINSYDKLETKNADIIKNINNSKNTNTSLSYNSNFVIDDYVFDEDYDINEFSDNDNEQINMAIKNSLNDVNKNSNNNSSKTTLEIYIEELQNNEILPYKPNSLKNNNFTPNFKSYYNTVDKFLVYCPHDSNLPNIELNYKIFNTQFQLELCIILIRILNFPNKFNNTWINIGNIINTFTNSYKKNNKNITDKNITDKNITDKNINDKSINDKNINDKNINDKNKYNLEKNKINDLLNEITSLV